MDYELNAIVVTGDNKMLEVYENDLSDFGYIITHCSTDLSEIIRQTVCTNCDLILLSVSDFENEDKVIELAEYFDKGFEKKNGRRIPLIVNAALGTSRKLENAINTYDFFFNFFPTGERRSIIIELERTEKYNDMSCDKLLFLLRQKISYECRFIGLSNSHEGFRWISEAIALITAEGSYRKNFTAGVYKVLENKYRITYNQIESAIRRCMNEFQNRMDPLIKVYYFDLAKDSTEKYTVTAFINKIADNVKLQYGSNYAAYMQRVDYDRRKALNEHFRINQ